MRAIVTADLRKAMGPHGPWIPQFWICREEGKPPFLGIRWRTLSVFVYYKSIDGHLKFIY